VIGGPPLLASVRVDRLAAWGLSAAWPLSSSSLAAACSLMRLTFGRCRYRLADAAISSYRSASLGAQHIPGGPTDGHAQGSSSSPSAATRPNPPGTLADGLAGRLAGGPRLSATLHGNPYR
jgi:hypothetical protein